MESKLQELKNRLIVINDLQSANDLLGWDQLTYMPVGGAEARGRQSATLARLAQEMFTDSAIGKLLDELRPYEENMPYDSDEASLIRVTRREYDRLVKIPSSLVGELYAHTAASYQAWVIARQANDFAAMVPFLEKALEFSHRIAEFFPGYEHIADPLIDFADYGMKASNIRAIFSQLRAQQVPIAQAITSLPPADRSCLHKHYPEAGQLTFANEVVRQIGYDFQRGRVDKTHHPFTTKFSLGDVRITTRVQEDYIGESLFSNIHEAGHAMYEQGIRMAFEGTPLANGTSAGIHESQSRLWENIVGRSREFWQFFYPRLQDVFPMQLKDISLDTFYRAINKVERSLIRTDADEVTYNLHVMIRFDLELSLLEGKLAVRDLAQAWQERYRSDIGIVSPTDSDGVLQDVHWYGGYIGGGFQGYTLGNVMGAQFYECALKAHPEIPGEIEVGKFDTLHGWLIENIYQHGSKFTAAELVERITGGSISIEPYIRYLKNKYGEIYQI